MLVFVLILAPKNLGGFAQKMITVLVFCSGLLKKTKPKGYITVYTTLVVHPGIIYMGNGLTNMIDATLQKASFRFQSIWRHFGVHLFVKFEGV